MFDDNNDQYDCDSKYWEFNTATLLFKFIMMVQRPTTKHHNCNVIVHVSGHLHSVQDLLRHFKVFCNPSGEYRTLIARYSFYWRMRYNTKKKF